MHHGNAFKSWAVRAVTFMALAPLTLTTVAAQRISFEEPEVSPGDSLGGEYAGAPWHVQFYPSSQFVGDYGGIGTGWHTSAGYDLLSAPGEHDFGNAFMTPWPLYSPVSLSVLVMYLVPARAAAGYLLDVDTDTDVSPSRVERLRIVALDASFDVVASRFIPPSSDGSATFFTIEATQDFHYLVFEYIGDLIWDLDHLPLPIFGYGLDDFFPRGCGTNNEVVGWWPFDGTGMDLTGGGVTAFPPFPATYVPAPEGDGLQLDGLAEWVSFPDHPHFEVTGQSRSLNMHVKPAAGGNGGGLFGKGVVQASQAAYSLSLDGASQLVLSVSTGVVALTATSTAQVPEDEWSCVSLTMRYVQQGVMAPRIDFTAYVDSEIFLTQSVFFTQPGQLLENTSLFEIGRDPTTGNLFEGAIDDFEVYPRLLTEAELDVSCGCPRNPADCDQDGRADVFQIAENPDLDRFTQDPQTLDYSLAPDGVLDTCQGVLFPGLLVPAPEGGPLPPGVGVTIR